MTLLRICIVFPQASYIAEVQKHHASLTSYPRLLNGAHICCMAARVTVTDALYLADQGRSSALFNITPIFLSTVVLALGILQQPARRVARADLELLGLASSFMETYLSRWVHEKAFASLGGLLFQRVAAFFHRPDHNDSALAGTSIPRSGHPNSPVSSEGGNKPAYTPLGVQSAEEGQSGTQLGPFEGLQFDDLWNIIGGDLLLDDNAVF